ncbi:hypothetical protein BKA82DRAFT_4019968 [Pisolithus tinctorius]|nr:hypothetical protein BKA82DRAFT_4019968 [Pisolithus tinctorius]
MLMQANKLVQGMKAWKHGSIFLTLCLEVQGTVWEAGICYLVWGVGSSLGIGDLKGWYFPVDEDSKSDPNRSKQEENESDSKALTQPIVRTRRVPCQTSSQQLGRVSDGDVTMGECREIPLPTTVTLKRRRVGWDE